MKIIINGLALVDDHFSGIGHYIDGIVSALDVTHGETHDIRVLVPFDKRNKLISLGYTNVRPALYPLPFRIMVRLARRRLLPPLDLLYGKAYYIFPHFIDLPLLFSKSSLVVYDLSYVLYPQYADTKNATNLTKYVARSIRHVDHVVTISESVKREVCEYYALPESFVSVAPPAADTQIFYRKSADEIRRVLSKYDLPEKYILSLSNLEPRKNLDGLIDAYCALPRSVTDKYSLVVVGANGWKTTSLLRKIDQKIADGYRIVRPNQYVLDEDKPALYSGATVLAFASHYEGFGMPPLEALACGTPVITSSNSSLPEAVGSLGILINSAEVEQLTAALESVVSDKVLAARIKTEGPAFAKNFSWKKSAQKYIDIGRMLLRNENKTLK